MSKNVLSRIRLLQYEKQSYLSTYGVIVSIDHVSLGILPPVPRCVGEPLAENRSKADVVATSSPLEVAWW